MVCNGSRLQYDVFRRIYSSILSTQVLAIYTTRLFFPRHVFSVSSLVVTSMLPLTRPRYFFVAMACSRFSCKYQIVIFSHSMFPSVFCNFGRLFWMTDVAIQGGLFRGKLADCIFQQRNAYIKPTFLCPFEGCHPVVVSRSYVCTLVKQALQNVWTRHAIG